MQVPERLTLIGGGILLSSTLIFTLKSQASQIIPKVGNSISNVYDHIGDAQRSNDFNDNYQQAKQKGWQIGEWGSAPYYVDDQQNMHVGSGKLNGSYTQLVDYAKVQSIDFTASVQAPRDSRDLLSPIGSGDHSESALTHINGLTKLDTSNVTNMYDMLSGDSNLNSLDLSHFDTHNVNQTDFMFKGDHSLKGLDLSSFDTSNVTKMSYMFFGDSSLQHLNINHFNTHNADSIALMFTDNSSLQELDLEHFDTSRVNNMFLMFNNDKIKQLTLGPNIKLQGNPSNLSYNAYLNGKYQNGNQVLTGEQLEDGQSHPGTWVRQ